jgi:hypothetical protein
MNSPGNGAAAKDALDLPAFSLEVQALDLGAEVKAVVSRFWKPKTANRCVGSRPRISGPRFSCYRQRAVHAGFLQSSDRVRDFCASRQIAFHEAGPRCIVIQQPAQEQLQQLFERFETETFGFRAGPRVKEDDLTLTNELCQNGLDAYQAAYQRYSFCAVCEFEDGWVTLLSQKIWPSEVIARAPPRRVSTCILRVRTRRCGFSRLTPLGVVARLLVWIYVGRNQG